MALFSLLPTEVLGLILDLVPAPDVFRLGRVCSRWRRCVLTVYRAELKRSVVSEWMGRTPPTLPWVWPMDDARDQDDRIVDLLFTEKAKSDHTMVSLRAKIFGTIFESLLPNGKSATFESRWEGFTSRYTLRHRGGHSLRPADVVMGVYVNNQVAESFMDATLFIGKRVISKTESLGEVRRLRAAADALGSAPVREVRFFQEGLKDWTGLTWDSFLLFMGWMGILDDEISIVIKWNDEDAASAPLLLEMIAVWPIPDEILMVAFLADVNRNLSLRTLSGNTCYLDYREGRSRYYNFMDSPLG